MASEEIAIELTAPAGESVRVVWPPAALTGGRRGGETAGWRLEEKLDWDAVEALRILSAPLPDGRGLALAALRPLGATGHGEESIAAALVADGRAEEVADALLSVEYGGDGLPRRVGLELYSGTEAMPLRVAADVTATSREREGELMRVRAALEVRLDGKRAAGEFAILTPA